MCHILPHSFPYRRHLSGLICFGTQSHSNLSGCRDKNSSQFVFQFIHMTSLKKLQATFSNVVRCAFWKKNLLGLFPSVNTPGCKNTLEQQFIIQAQLELMCESKRMSLKNIHTDQDMWCRQPRPRGYAEKMMQQL